MNATVHIDTASPIGTISPRLYGHFAEHLGRCCYGGLWVGPDSGIPNMDGFRADVVALLRALPVPLLRWPGGCYADHYHWRDGVGPKRAERLGMSCGLQVPDRNELGTHEFMRLCDLLGAEAFLAGNLGSGSVQEMCDWLEYVNGQAETDLTRERAANGRPDPWNVKLWGVGNESWGCGGNYDAAAYAREFRRYATMLRHVDETAQLVAVGLEDEGCFQAGMERDWNEKVLNTLGVHLPLVDHLSIHRYWTGGGPEINFGDEDYYALLAEAEATEEGVKRAAAVIARATGGKHRIGVALDEWGVWHPEARASGPGDHTHTRTPVTYEQGNTLRDALAAGVALEGFHRQCGVLSLANLAQVVNVLQAVVMTDGPICWATPTYHALALHAPHVGATALKVTVDGGEAVPASAVPASAFRGSVSATASRQADGSLAVTVINRHLERAASVFVPVDGVRAEARILTADCPRATNGPEHPARVTTEPLEVAREEAGWRVELPPHSMVTVRLFPGGEP